MPTTGDIPVHRGPRGTDGRRGPREADGPRRGARSHDNRGATCPSTVETKQSLRLGTADAEATPGNPLLFSSLCNAPLTNDLRSLVQTGALGKKVPGRTQEAGDGVLLRDGRPAACDVGDSGRGRKPGRLDRVTVGSAGFRRVHRRKGTYHPPEMTHYPRNSAPSPPTKEKRRSVKASFTAKRVRRGCYPTQRTDRVVHRSSDCDQRPQTDPAIWGSSRPNTRGFSGLSNGWVGQKRRPRDQVVYIRGPRGRFPKQTASRFARSRIQLESLTSSLPGPGLLWSNKRARFHFRSTVTTAAAARAP